MNRIMQFGYLTIMDAQISVYIMAALGAFFGGISFFIAIMFILVFLDLVTGIRKSRAKGIQFIWAKGIHRTVDKLGAYGIMIVSFALIDKLLGVEQMIWYVTTAKTATVVIAVTETKSIVENISTYMDNRLAKRILHAMNNWFKGYTIKDDIYDELKNKENTKEE